MKDKINEQLVLLEKELSRLKKVTDYIDDSKKTAQVVISELKEVQNNYSTYTEKIFDLYKTTVEQLKKETELQIMEGVIHFETTGSKIDQTNKEIQENYSTYTEKIFDLYKTTVEQLKRETEIQIKEGVIHFETTGSKIDQTNREKLVETKRLLENYKNTVEATDNLVKTLEAVDFPTRLDAIELKISRNLEEIKILEAIDFPKRLDRIELKVSKNLEEFSQRFNIQDKQNKITKALLFVILGLILIGGIGAILVMTKII